MPLPKTVLYSLFLLLSAICFCFFAFPIYILCRLGPKETFERSLPKVQIRIHFLSHWIIRTSYIVYCTTYSPLAFRTVTLYDVLIIFVFRFCMDFYLGFLFFVTIR